MILLAHALSLAVIGGWIWSGTFLHLARFVGRTGGPSLKAVFHELKPFYWPAICVQAVTDAFMTGVGWDDLLVVGIWAGCWWAMRNDGDDDDRWRKRRKKLAERVSIVAGRLAVVPATGGA